MTEEISLSERMACILAGKVGVEDMGVSSWIISRERLYLPKGAVVKVRYEPVHEDERRYMTCYYHDFSTHSV
jgi:hypothetical protein